MTPSVGQSQPKLQNFPSQPTPFIGREAEIAYLTERLTDPVCRLLTVIGAGGIGKTRLAMQAAAGLPGHFAQGIYFAPLQGIDTNDFLISSLAEAVNFSLSGHLEPLAQVLNYLSDKAMLLLLDNFEQLVEQGGPTILSEILAAARAVKLLVTSREALNLQEEWLYSLQGLPVPAEVGQDGTEPGSAVQLFVSRARQVRPDFSLADQAKAVWQICQLVEGIPLAVELAASWTKMLSCQAIAAEIQRSISFLVTPLRNLPDRHRSMAAVFDYSWRLLSGTEQEVFKRLSVFRGGFQREAAEQVAGASLANLTALVDKSLLRREANDRYQIHELLRQYGQEKLQATPEVDTNTHQAHCRYYTNFLDQRGEDLEGGQQRRAALEIEAELENIRVARAWAAGHHRLLEIQKSLHSYAFFTHFQSRYMEAANALEQDLACLESHEPSGQAGLTLAETLVRLGWFYIRLGRYEEASAVLHRNLSLMDALDAPPNPAGGTDALSALAILAIIGGDSNEAVRLGEESRRINEAHTNQHNLPFSFHALTSATLAQGNYEQARQYAQKACEASEAAGNQWYLAYCLNGWGNAARAMGDYAEAEQHFQKSYRIRELFDDPEGMAVALNHLGDIALRQADYSAAQQRYQQSLAIYQEVNDRGGLAIAFDGLGQTACGLNGYPAAAQHFQQALSIANEIQYLPLLCALFVNIGELFLKVGLSERGLAQLAFIRDHPAVERETKDRAEHRLEQGEADYSPEQFSDATQNGQQHDFETMVTQMQHDLALVAEGTFPQTKAANQPLLDPLTERELEVLRLMAAGHSNREIGDTLVLALGSVKWYASQIYSKLQVKNRTEAAAKARALKLL